MTRNSGVAAGNRPHRPGLEQPGLLDRIHIDHLTETDHHPEIDWEQLRTVEKAGALRSRRCARHRRPRKCLDVVSFGESAVADEGCRYANEREEVLGFAFVA
ncbi:hypothetical protein ACWC9Q_36860, partial [Streptomyces sp. NPDC001142]